MAAYLILNYDVLDAELLAAYRQAAAPMLVGPRAEALLVSTPNTLDLGEASDAGTDTVIIRFEDRAHALRAYHSGAYQAILRGRLPRPSHASPWSSTARAVAWRTVLHRPKD